MKIQLVGESVTQTAPRPVAARTGGGAGRQGNFRSAYTIYTLKIISQAH